VPWHTQCCCRKLRQQKNPQSRRYERNGQLRLARPAPGPGGEGAVPRSRQQSAAEGGVPRGGGLGGQPGPVVGVPTLGGRPLGGPRRPWPPGGAAEGGPGAGQVVRRPHPRPPRAAAALPAPVLHQQIPLLYGAEEPPGVGLTRPPPSLPSFHPPRPNVTLRPITITIPAHSSPWF